MSSNTPLQSSYLRTSRNFPSDQQALVVELSKSYVDIAGAVNNRIIGTFPVNRPVVTGQNWFFEKPGKQQGFRQVYTFTAIGNIPHGIDLDKIWGFVQAYGSFTDGTNWYGAIYASNVAIAGQVTFYITPLNIVILNGGGAPVITKGILVLEWLAQT